MLPIICFYLFCPLIFLEDMWDFNNFATVIEINRHIEILLLSNDCVIVPGFGGFMAHYVDARKDEADGSFLPPIRNIGFNPKVTVNDSLLVQSFVDSYDISYPEACKRVEKNVEELKQRISTEGYYEFNGIGTVSVNSEGNYEFSPCKAGILTPELYGLGSFGMQTLSELNGISAKPWTVVSSEQPSAEKEDTHAAEYYDYDDDANTKHTQRVIAMWRNVAVACIAAIVFLIIPSPLVNSAQMAGNSIDFRLLNRVMPHEVTTGRQNVENAIKNTSKVVKMVESQNVEAVGSTEASTDEAQPAGHFSIVLASRVTKANAEEYVAKLTKRGYKDVRVHQNGLVKVVMGSFSTREEAMKALQKLRANQEFSGAWVVEL